MNCSFLVLVQKANDNLLKVYTPRKPINGYTTPRNRNMYIKKSERADLKYRQNTQMKIGDVNRKFLYLNAAFYGRAKVYFASSCNA